MNKICTSIEQSKKLIELGIDVSTADMAYWKRSYRPNDYAIMVHYTKELQEGFEAKGVEYIPAWSLAALLSVLPRIDIEKEIYSDDTYDYRVKAYIDDGYVGDWFDNPIDACYDMIITLNKDKLL